jgi:hypothetical protein
MGIQTVRNMWEDKCRRQYHEHELCCHLQHAVLSGLEVYPGLHLGQVHVVLVASRTQETPQATMGQLLAWRRFREGEESSGAARVPLGAIATLQVARQTKTAPHHRDDTAILLATVGPIIAES